MHTPSRMLASLFVSSTALACGVSSPSPGPGSPGCATSATINAMASATPLSHRAYVVSKNSGNVTVLDLDHLTILGSLETCGRGNHMAELNADFSKVYVDSPGTGESIVFDANTLQVTKHIPVGVEPTHLSLSRDGKLLAIVNEFENTVSFVDPVRDVEVKRLDGFYLPHFVRFAPDGRYAYVANLDAYHITRIDLSTLAVDGQIVLDGFGVPPSTPALDDSSGFADVQIDHDGVLYAAHARTGRVLVYDTKTRTKVGELPVGAQPWIVYAQHPFTQITKHVVPNFGDQTVSLIAPASFAVAEVGGADRESFGVNYSPLAPNRAYVMNRYKNEIAILDTEIGKRVGSIPVGGTTETASTTADGKYIVATVSSANRVVVIDAANATVVKTFDNVGSYPWSVTIPLGQNYCH